jgi:hypothetical protein
MRFRSAFHCLCGLLGGASAWLVASDGAAADKAAVACIQAAEEGETARKTGDILHARELFAQCSARECPTMLRRDCAGWLEDAERQIPSIVLGAHDAQGNDVVDARASVDGTLVREHLDGNAIALNPGSHVVRFESTGKVPSEVRVVLRAGEKNRPILATLAPPAPPAPAVPPSAGSPRTAAPAPASPPPSVTPAEEKRSVPAGAWVLGGVGLAAFGVFGYFGLTGMNDATTLRTTCAPGCTDAQISAVRMKLVAADIGLGVGILSVVAAVWIGVRGLTHSRGAAPASAWEIVVAPSLTGSQAGLVVRF